MWVSALSLVSGTLARTLGVLDVSSPQAEVFPLGGEFLVTKLFPVRMAFFRRVALRCFKDLAVVCSESAELEPRAEVPHACLQPPSTSSLPLSPSLGPLHLAVPLFFLSSLFPSIPFLPHSLFPYPAPFLPLTLAWSASAVLQGLLTSRWKEPWYV